VTQRRFYQKDWIFLFRRFVLRQFGPKMWEPATYRYLRGQSGQVCIDVGANFGVYSRLLARRFKVVHAFEPDPFYLAKLKDLERMPGANVWVHPLALSNQKGTASFFPFKKDPVQSMGTLLEKFEYKPAGSQTDRVWIGKNPIQVDTATFDEIFPKTAVDLVKIDVEGAEFMVLEGMRKAFSEGRIQKIVVELHNREKTRDLEALLKWWFLRLRWLDPGHLMAEYPRVGLEEFEAS